jgi:hypothetical protein
MIYLEHDDGAGQEKTVETAPIRQTDRAITPQGRAQKSTEIVIHPSHTKEHRMKHGHVTGHKKERKGASDWYKQIEEENIKRIEAEWQAKQQGK